MNATGQNPFPHHAKVSLPTGTVPASADLYWLHSHSAGKESPLGVRYLQWRKRLTKAGDLQKLRTESAAAYNRCLSQLQSAFESDLAGVEWGLAVQAPSCAPHAQEFAALAPRVRPDSLVVVFAYDCQEGERKDSAEGASVEQLQAAMFAAQPLPRLGEVRQVMVIDDVYADGKTAAAVVRKLWAHGLSPEALVSVAVVLRVLPSKPCPKRDWLKIVKESSEGAT